MKSYALVYQAGIANVFEVEGYNLSAGRFPVKRIRQGDFRSCELFCEGLACAGATVRSCHCNMAGDVATQAWNSEMDDALWREKMHPVNAN